MGVLIRKTIASAKFPDYTVTMARLVDAEGPHDRFAVFHRGTFRNSTMMEIGRFSSAADAWCKFSERCQCECPTLK